MTEDRRRPRGAIDKALALLTELQSAGGTVRLSELSRRTGLPKSTTHRVLNALFASGAVIRAGAGYRAADNHPDTEAEARPHPGLCHTLAPFLGDVLMRTGLTASLAMLDGSHVVFPHRVYGHDGVWMPSDNSRRGCAYATAAGRLLMAFTPATARHTAAVRGLDLDEAAELDRDLLLIRSNRFVVKQIAPGISCLAVPVLGIRGMPYLALTVRGESDRIDVERTLHWLWYVAADAARAIVSRTDRSVRPLRPTAAARPRGLRPANTVMRGKAHLDRQRSWSNTA